MNQTMTNLFPKNLFSFLFGKCQGENEGNKVSNLTKARLNQEYEIKDIAQENSEMVHFLFTLGCFKGEPITLVSVLSDTYVINVKDARYSIDVELAKMIILN